MEETKTTETSPLSRPEADIEAIVKKPRKPRMSSVVSKAVLLKQMSDADMISSTAKQEKVEIVVEKTPVPIIDEILPPTFSAKQVKKSKKVVTPTPPPSPEIVDEHSHPLSRPEATVSEIVLSSAEREKFVGECALCNCKFKSKVLFERHPETFKHKLNKDKHYHMSRESKK